MWSSPPFLVSRVCCCVCCCGGDCRTNTATRRAGDLDAKSSTLSSTGLGRGESMTLDISQPNSIMNPSQSSSLLLESSSGSLPLVSPLVTGNAQSRRGPGFTTTGGSSSTGVLSPLRGARKPVGTGNGNTSTLSPAHTLRTLLV